MDLKGVGFKLSGSWMDRFASRAWSCGDFIAGASCVVDEMHNDMEAVQIQHELLGAHEDLSDEALEKLLQDLGTKYFWVSVVKLFYISWWLVTVSGD